MTTQKELNNMLKDTIKDAISLGITVCKIYPDILIDYHMNHVGVCRISNIKNYNYEIYLRDDVIEKCDKNIIKNIIAHEVLHSNPDCFNHSNKWFNNVFKMNANGYRIKLFLRLKDIGISSRKLKPKDTKEFSEITRITLISNNNISKPNNKTCSVCGEKMIMMKLNYYKCSKCSNSLKFSILK